MSETKQPGGEITRWEKAIGGVGVVFVVGILAFLIWEALQPHTPPVILVQVEQVAAVEGGYRVEVEAQNVGESTGAAVEIEGTLTPVDDPDGEPVETSTLTFDYIPSRSVRHGGLFFQADPSQYTLDVRALGYQTP